MSRVTYEINESSSGKYTATLQDENGDPIPSASVSSLKLTLVEYAGGTVINGRNGQNVLNANNCTLHATSGLFTWLIQPADTAIILVGTSRAKRLEEHLATLSVAWANGAQHHEILLKITNLKNVPQA